MVKKNLLKSGTVTDTKAIFIWQENPTDPESITINLNPAHGTIKNDLESSSLILSDLKPYTDYNINVSAGSRAYTKSFRTELSPPAISAESSNDYIMFKWTSVHKGKGVVFEFKYRVNGKKWNNEKPEKFSYKIDKLKLGDVCEAMIRISYDGQFSKWAECKAKTIVPVPKNFSVSNSNLGEVKVSWSPVLKEMGTQYKVKFCEVGVFSDGDAYEANSKTENAIIIPSLKCNKDYKFSVKAIVGAFESEWADDYSITTSKIEPPERIEVFDVTDSAIEVKWVKINNDKVSYEVEYWKKSFFFDMFAKSEFVSTTTGSATICGLEANTTYKVRVRSIFKGEKSGWSDNHDFQTLNPPSPKKRKIN